MVILGQLTFTFEDLDEYTWLVIGISSEDLLLLGGDGSISLNKGSHNTTSSFNTHREGSNIQKKDILDTFWTRVGKDGSLNGSTISNSLIGIDGSIGFLAIEEILDELDNLGDTGRTTN